MSTFFDLPEDLRARIWRRFRFEEAKSRVGSATTSARVLRLGPQTDVNIRIAGTEKKMSIIRDEGIFDVTSYVDVWDTAQISFRFSVINDNFVSVFFGHQVSRKEMFFKDVVFWRPIQSFWI
jgi:hypothetical protein